MIAEFSATKAASIATAVGLASLVVGVGTEAAGIPGSDLLSGFNVFAGGSLLVMVWVSRRISSIAEKFFEDNGRKLIDLPHAAQLKADRQSLEKKLNDLATKWDEHREDSARDWLAFRTDLAERLSDHNARIRELEQGRAK